MKFLDRINNRSKSPDIDPFKFRGKILTLLFFIAALVLTSRLVLWQIIKSDSLGVLARNQYEIKSTLVAHRGSILSSDSFPLASSSESYLVWANLKEIKERENYVKLLAPIFATDVNISEATNSAKESALIIKDEEERLRKLFNRNDVSWIPLKKKVSRELKKKIEELKLAGVGPDNQESRSYPESSMSAHILGFVGQDAAGGDKGYFGIEGFYDLTLSGRKGIHEWEKDARGSLILLGKSNEINAHDGLNLKTTVNRSIQYLVEKNLVDGVQKYEADGGTVIVMNPYDGAILASSSYPTYLPGNYSQFEKENYIDPAIGQSFEPGSIFKVFVMASALDAEVIKPDSQCQICDKPVVIDGFTIESGTDKNYPNSSMSDVIMYSDNVGMIWVSQQLGKDALFDYLDKFGIGKATGIDLQGETAPSMRKRGTWGIVDQFTASFGQGIAVTPIQMVRAVSAIASGGNLPKPHIVSEIISEGSGVTVKIPKPERIISEKASKDITDMMVNNVNSKADMWRPPLEFQLAGKTGTAQVAISGHYDAEKTVASFLGFGPTPNPKFAMIVTLKNPKTAPYAAQTAAPLWFKIAKDILPLTGARPNYLNQ